MPPVWYLDFETRSGLELTDVGADAYLAHPWADVWCLGYAKGDDPVRVVSHPYDIMEVANEIAASGHRIVAHNASFEYLVWNYILAERYCAPPLAPARFECTMAAGYAMSLPGSLDALSAALGIEAKKDLAGSRLAKQMSKPRKIDESGAPIWWNEPEKINRLMQYCAQDIEVLREVHRREIPLSGAERNTWIMDFGINRRGMWIDQPAANCAIQIVATEQGAEMGKLFQLTGGLVNGPSEVKKLTEWIQAQGVDIPGLAKQDVIDTLSTEGLPGHVREALTIRQNYAKTSTAKLGKMKSCAGTDGRVRGLLQYHASSTGRWGGRMIQPQNLPRPTISQSEIEEIIEKVRTTSPEEAAAYIKVFHGPPIARISDCLRGMLCAEPGKQLYVGDYANIEGRVLAWLAGEDWKVQAFKDFDEGKGNDLYLLAAARIFHKPVTAFNKKSPERQIGKVAELACLSGNTPVLTNNGVKPILEVTTEDKVWDGEAWVAHQGIIERGVRQVVPVDGIEVTPDHLILTGRTWRQARELVMCENTLFHALATGSASLPLSVSISVEREVIPRLSRFNALAEHRRTRCTTITSVKEEVLAAMRVLENNPRIGEKISGLMQTWCRQTITGGDCSIESQPASIDAQTQMIKDIRITEEGASRCTQNGAPIAERFLSIWYRCRDGIKRTWSLIGKMCTKGTNQVICGSSQKEKTKEIEEQYNRCSGTSLNLKPVYDLVSAGPRNRFTVITDSGAMIVHNCGYQGGVGAFQTMAHTYGVKVSDIEAEQIKQAWRAAHPNIQRYWWDLESAVIRAVETPGVVFRVRNVAFAVRGSFLWCQLPSGRRLCYPYPKLQDKDTPWGDVKAQLVYKTVDDRTRQWGETSTYGGKLAENITQAVARDILVHSMHQLEMHGWDIVLHVHDEIVAEDEPNRELGDYLALMSTRPSWAQDLPVAVEGWSGSRYRK